MALNRRADTYRQASEELANRLVILYGVKIFPRQGKVFADLLYQTGIEAGSYVAALGEVDERTAKIDVANNALIKLTQTDYLLSVMLKGRYYETSQVEDLGLFVRELIRAIRELLNTLYGPNANRFYTQMRPVFVPPARPQPQQATAYQQAPAAAPAPAPAKPHANGDPDGFDVPPRGFNGTANNAGNGEQNG